MKSESMTDIFREESDSILVAAIRNGQSQAFEFLVKRHEARTLALAFRITRNREDAQDVVQQSFHKAFMHLDRFQGKSLFSTWLTRIVINEGLMSLRRTRARKEVSLDDLKSESEDLFHTETPHRGENPEEICKRLQDEGILHEAMNHLGADFRTVVLFQLEERTVRETAEILGLGIATLKARLFRARQKLRALLTRVPELRRGRAMSKTRQRHDSRVDSHSPAEGTPSQRPRTVGHARVIAHGDWTKASRERTLRSAESKMLDVA
jgi:RNA polymerase sigma-70 factor (ECF subfamily)